MVTCGQSIIRPFCILQTMVNENPLRKLKPSEGKTKCSENRFSRFYRFFGSAKYTYNTQKKWRHVFLKLLQPKE